jgi:hypothetical protein
MAGLGNAEVRDLAFYPDIGKVPFKQVLDLYGELSDG